MKVKQVSSSLDINVFDDEDWDFFSDVGSNTGFDCINVSNAGSCDSRTSKKYKVKRCLSFIGVTLGCLFLGFVLIMCIIAITISTMSKVWSQDNGNNEVKQAPKSLVLDRVAGGEEVNNEEIQGVSSTLSTYFDVLGAEKGYSNLDNFCVDSSVFALLEQTYRTSSKESYDADDCSARALRVFGSCCSLVKIEDVLVKDGIYYCYARVKAPNTEELLAYYRKYNYDMTKFFTTNELSAMTVSQFMLGVVENGDIPTYESEWVFELKYDDDMYKLVDDSQVSDYCTKVYNISVDKVVTLIGGSVVQDTHD